ncbi:Glycosyl transferase, group 2 family protein [Pantoea agglomerans 299R]|nr:glycosyltransferase [Pantoea agglomerans]ELP25596.1 Glycosyl transferase, group 2 family protein [Pantoea agglomerans 299R]
MANLENILLKAGFRKNEETALWSPATMRDFAYSDGDDSENYIFDTIRNASDVTVDSKELGKFIVDWPSTYHLSSVRANLLRPFQSWMKDKRILEIGCGCGAISRYLGENAAEVVSVEGSYRRANIARSRCRDLDNVTVICAPSDTLPDLGKFDAVLLIGVLEYARVFIGEKGEQHLLKACKERLKDDGKIFVAIENKIGIKYFAGAREDHVNIPMFGINNSYDKQSVVTFGRKELISELNEAGFTDTLEYLPLPDYKLPCAVVTPLGWQNYSKELSQLAVESAHKEKQVVPQYLFSLEQGIKNIWNNEIAADLSSSFLMVSSMNKQESVHKNVAAIYYSDDRNTENKKNVEFIKTNEGLSVSSGSSQDGEVLCEELERFIYGQSLWSDLLRIVNRPDWLVEELAAWAKGWLDQLQLKACVSLDIDKDILLPDSYLDALPFNVIKKDNGEFVFFDQEWHASESITLGYVAYRGIYHSLLRVTSAGNSKFCNSNNIADLTVATLNVIGFSCSAADSRNYLRQEANFLAQVQHKNAEEIYSMLKEFSLSMRAEYWLDSNDYNSLKGHAENRQRHYLSRIEDLEKSLQGEHENSVRLQHELNQLHAIYAQQGHLLDQYRHDIEKILNSASWKISAPFRVAGRRLPERFRAPAKRTIFKMFYLGQKVKVKTGSLLVRVNAPDSNLKRSLRDFLRNLYLQLPERYKDKALKLAMKVRPSWFRHHPAFNQAQYEQGIINNNKDVHPTFLSRRNDGTYSFAERPDEYVYIPAKKPNFFEDKLNELEVQPLFSIIVPIYNTPLDLLELMVKSVENQWYSNWELVLANDCSPDKEIVPALNAFKDPRIKVIHMDKNQGIAGATNIAIDNASGDYIVFLDHDDELTEDCLFEFAKCINEEDPDFIYSDEDKFTPEGNYSQPHFKPDWSPDTMMGTMYTCHAACVRLSVAQKLGGLRTEFNGCQDWDFILRLCELTQKISHIPKVLYHWRIIPASVASDITAKPYVLAASKAVREDALKRRGIDGIVEELPGYHGYFRVNYNLRAETLVSIIIPTRDNHDVLSRCISSITDKTAWKHYEIVIVDNGSQKRETLDYLDKVALNENISVIRHDKPFNFSELNNVGVGHAKGSLLLFLNDDTEVLQEDWLQRLGGYAQQKHVGAVGAKLVYADGHTIQHTGVLNLQTGPVHAYIGHDKNNPGYFLRNQIEYNWLAVTGACLMIDRQKYESINGFDESFPIAYNDVDICMRLVEKGYYNVMCQAVTLIHHESVSRGLDHMDEVKVKRLQNELGRLNSKHPQYYQHDPFYNVNFAFNGHNFEIMK